MGKLKCKCGNIISDVLCPSPDKSWIISDEQLEDLEDRGKVSYLSLMERDVWHCRECGRIAIDQRGNNMKWYKEE